MRKVLFSTCQKAFRAGDSMRAELLFGDNKATPPAIPLFIMQFFGENWSNSMLAPPSGVGAPLWEILDPPLQAATCMSGVTFALLGTVTRQTSPLLGSTFSLDPHGNEQFTMADPHGSKIFWINFMFFFRKDKN